MKLAKALKEKNRLAGEVNRLKNLFQRENSRNVKASSKVDASKVWADLMEATDKLIAVKSAIFKANAGIYEKIVRMGELKSRTAWINMVNTNNETTETPYGEHMIKEENKAWMTREGVDNQIVTLQNEIAALQDEIDEYNATTEI